MPDRLYGLSTRSLAIKSHKMPKFSVCYDTFAKALEVQSELNVRRENLPRLLRSYVSARTRFKCSEVWHLWVLQWVRMIPITLMIYIYHLL